MTTSGQAQEAGARLLTQRLRALLAAATPGPWEARPPHAGLDDEFGLLVAQVGQEYPITPGGGEAGDDGTWPPDAHLIVEAVNALPDLLDLVDRLSVRADHWDRLADRLADVHEREVLRSCAADLRDVLTGTTPTTPAGTTDHEQQETT